MTPQITGLLLLFVLCGCRERYHDTPKLVAAKSVAKGGGGSAVKTSGPPQKLGAALKGGTLVFEDDFERAEFGDRWTVETPNWKIKSGEVTNHHADNKGMWLLEKLPKGDLRVEFSARSDTFMKKGRDGSKKETFPGDLKCEAFNMSPEHQTGYVFIFGGWNNRVNRIARLEEHGDGAGARVTDGPLRPVKPGHTYRMAVVRVGNTIGWYADGDYLAHLDDPQFIEGQHFGFNNWRSRLTFDNVKVFQLTP
jgi:hypothetical protein